MQSAGGREGGVDGLDGRQSSLDAIGRLLLSGFTFSALTTIGSAAFPTLHVVVVDTESLIDLSTKSSIVINPVKCKPIIAMMLG